jgi:hypothetical protein
LYSKYKFIEVRLMTSKANLKGGSHCYRHKWA